jgi:hypothetical protein
MEKNVELKVKEAFQNRDATVEYERKDELWERISNGQKLNTGVNMMWKIAAVLFAVFLITGAFAVFLSTKKLQKQLTDSEKRNFELNLIIDSLQKVTTLSGTEIKYIEKEVKVFVPVENKVMSDVIEKQQFENLKQENNLLKKQLDFEMINWQNKTDSLVRELLVLNNLLEQNTSYSEKLKNTQTNVVEIKPDKYEPPLQQKLQSSNPKLKIQLFPNSTGKTKFDMNTSIFKK